MNTQPADVRIKIDRARAHLAALDAEGAKFGETTPFDIVRGTDEVGNAVARIVMAQQPPRVMAAIVGDIVHNLRSALDYVAWQLVDANRGRPGKHTAYPVCLTEEKFDAASALHGAATEAIQTVRRMQPFTGAPPESHPLAVLDDLDNRDKHCLLHVVGGVVEQVLAKPAPGTGPTFVHRTAKKLLVDGDTIATVKSAGGGAIHIRVTVGLVLNSENTPLRQFLESLFTFVDEVLAAVSPHLA
jgi:hypothetical protein